MFNNEKEFIASDMQHAIDINKTLYAITNAVNTTSDLPTLYKEIHQTLGAVLDVTNFYIAIIDPKNKQLKFPYHVDEKSATFHPVPIEDVNRSLTGLVVTGQKAVLLSDGALRELSNNNRIKGATPKNWLGAPLRIEGVVTGVVAVQSYDNPDCFSNKDLEIMTTVSDQIAIAISRKQAEERVIESEKRYRALFEKSKDAILIIKDREFVDCNQATVELLGYRNKHQLLQTHPSKLSPPFQPDGRESFEKAEEMMETAVRKGSHRFEWDHVKAGGTIFPVEVLLTTISTEKDNQEIHTIWRDITERKKAEQKLFESEKRYRTLFEKSKDAILIIKNREFVDCNQATVDMLGYKNKRQLLQAHPSKLSPPFQPDGRESFEKAEEMMGTAVKNGSHRFEWVHVKADGTIFPVEVLLTAISTEAGNQEIHTIWRDITERKKAEAEIRDSQRRMKAILEANPDPMVVYDLNGHPLYLNPAFSKVFGWTLDELKGCRIPFVPGNQKELTAEVINEIYKHGKPISFEAQRLTKAGAVLDIIISAAINKNDKGEIIGAIVNLTNITERKRLEAQYKQAQKMEAIGTLAGGIAHDFNNILSGIFGYTQLAERDINTPEKAVKHLSQVIHGARRAAELVQQILAFSRRSEYQKQMLNLSTIVKEAIKLLRSSIPTTIDILTRIDLDAMVMADPTRMHQVIINLATNAYHAMRESGGTMTVSLTEREIGEPLKLKNRQIPPGKYLCLSVEDTGLGMDDKTLEKAFEPYFTTKEIGKGTGFGLALVHAIVEEHDGFIEAESVLNEGSVFRVFLPLIEKKALSTAEDHKPRKAINGRERIMVVDDEPSIRHIAKEVLQRYGYTVSIFENGSDAFDAYEKNPSGYDLLISDMTMPIMTGDHLTRKILEITPDFPVILCTGFSENFSEEQALKIGVKKFLFKPVANRDLVVAIREVLDA